MRPSVRPVGPLPASVYWKRRALVFVVVLPVLWALVAWLLPDDEPDAGAPVTVTTTEARPTTTASASPSRKAQPKPVKSSKPASSKPSVKPVKPKKPKKPLPPGQHPPCQAPAVSIAVGAKVQKAGKPLAIKVTYANESSGTCQVAISPSSLRLTVISGVDRIWDSDDCKKLIPTAPLTLQKGKPRTITITWSGRRSTSGCPADGDVAKAGYYAVKLTVSGVAVNQARFRLT
ncbi:hypothetical protein [Flindersiella endophytica]